MTGFINRRKLVSGFFATFLVFFGLLFCKINVYAALEDDLNGIQLNHEDFSLAKTQEEDYAKLGELLSRYTIDELKQITLEDIDKIAGKSDELAKLLKKNVYGVEGGDQNRISYTLKKGGNVAGRVVLFVLKKQNAEGKKPDNFYLVTAHAWLNKDLVQAEKDKVAELVKNLMSEVRAKEEVIAYFAGCTDPGDSVLNAVFDKVHSLGVGEGYRLIKNELNKDEFQKISKGALGQDKKFKFFSVYKPGKDDSLDFIVSLVDGALGDEKMRSFYLEEVSKLIGPDFVKGILENFNKVLEQNE